MSHADAFLVTDGYHYISRGGPLIELQLTLQLSNAKLYPFKQWAQRDAHKINESIKPDKEYKVFAVSVGRWAESD